MGVKTVTTREFICDYCGEGDVFTNDGAAGQAGWVMAAGLGIVALMWLIIARSLQRGQQWARITVLTLSVLSIAATGYDAWHFQDSQVLVGIALPVLYVMLLSTRAARSWFRWGTW